MITVDVVVPCYNYGRFLPACVRSIVSQAGVDTRILIIDDSSTDNSCEVGKQLADTHKNVEFRRHEVNAGHIATYNEGLLEWSTSKYVVLLSADDMLSPGALHRATHIMEEEPGVSMVYGKALHFSEEAELPLVSNKKAPVGQYSGEDWIERRCRAGYNVISSPEVVIRGSAQRKVGGYRPELPHTGDLEMWLRLAAVGAIGHVRRVPQAFYRVHQESMMRTRFSQNVVDLRQRKAAFESFFSHHPHLPGKNRLQATVNRTLAREALWDACRAYDRNRLDNGCAMELRDFALNTYAGAHTLSEYSALRRREILGARLCQRTQIFLFSAAARRIARWPQRWRRDLWGV